MGEVIVPSGTSMSGASMAVTGRAPGLRGRRSQAGPALGWGPGPRRRPKGHSDSLIKTGKRTVNLDTRTVDIDCQPLHLTGKEYGILELLSLRKGTTLTKEMFLNHLYGGTDEPELKIIDVFVCKLRKKLTAATGGENYIETVWGRGYVLRDPAPVEDTAKEQQVAANG